MIVHHVRIALMRDIEEIEEIEEVSREVDPRLRGEAMQTSRLIGDWIISHMSEKTSRTVEVTVAGVVIAVAHVLAGLIIAILDAERTNRVAGSARIRALTGEVARVVGDAHRRVNTRGVDASRWNRLPDLRCLYTIRVAQTTPEVGAFSAERTNRVQFIESQ